MNLDTDQFAALREQVTEMAAQVVRIHQQVVVKAQYEELKEAAEGYPYGPPAARRRRVRRALPDYLRPVSGGQS